MNNPNWLARLEAAIGTDDRIVCKDFLTVCLPNKARGSDLDEYENEPESQKHEYFDMGFFHL